MPKKVGSRSSNVYSPKMSGLEEGLVLTRVILIWALVLLDFRALKKLKSSCLVKNVRVSFSTAHFGKIYHSCSMYYNNFFEVFDSP